MTYTKKNNNTVELNEQQEQLLIEAIIISNAYESVLFNAEIFHSTYINKKENKLYQNFLKADKDYREFIEYKNVLKLNEVEFSRWTKLQEDKKLAWDKYYQYSTKIHRRNTK